MLLFGVDDISGIVSLDVALAGKPLKLAPGLAGAKLFRNGLQARARVWRPARATHSRSNCRSMAAAALQFLPLGNSTAIDMTSDWPDPGFTGALLPQTHTIRQTASRLIGTRPTFPAPIPDSGVPAR